MKTTVCLCIFILAINQSVNTDKIDDALFGEDDIRQIPKWTPRKTMPLLERRIEELEEFFDIEDGIYGTPNARSLETRESTSPPKYVNLCKTTKEQVVLSTSKEFEYRPESYHEFRCVHLDSHHHAGKTDATACNSVGFHCRQKYKTIYLSRRPYSASSDCWEPEERRVPAACECMWPIHLYDDQKFSFINFD